MYRIRIFSYIFRNSDIFALFFEIIACFYVVIIVYRLVSILALTFCNLAWLKYLQEISPT